MPVDEASAFETGFPGKRQGLRAAPRSERGFRRASASRGSSKGGKALAHRLSKGRPEGLRPRREPAERTRLRPARSDPGTRRRDSGLAQATRRGSARGLRASPETHRMPNGALASLRRPRRAKRAFAPASRSAAAQREMASPPSDGSQGWDKWGPVATPAPITIPAPSFPRLKLVSDTNFAGKKGVRKNGVRHHFSRPAAPLGENWCQTPICVPGSGSGLPAQSRPLPCGEGAQPLIRLALVS